jgi:hypothetical protein
LKDVIDRHAVGGLELQCLSGLPWFVVNVVYRVKADPSVYDLGCRYCAIYPRINSSTC